MIFPADSKVLVRTGYLVSMIALAITACDTPSGYSATPENAKGDTPIRYVICGAGARDCFVAARFNNISNCESHKNWSEMLCDSRSDPTKMDCVKSHDNVASGYCTK